MKVVMMTRHDLIRMFALQYERIVDIGCHLGECFGSRATNVDFISAETRRGWTANSGLYIHDVPNFVLAEASRLPFKDQSYDVAVLSEMLEHIGIEDPVAVVNEAQRVARFVIICVPNEHQWAPWRLPFTSTDHKRFYTEEMVFQLCTDAGLGAIQYIKTTYDGWSHFIIFGLSKHAKD